MTAEDARLDRLWQRGRDLLGSRYAILGGAMSWVSERNLVAAISNAGGFGVIACGSMTPKLLADEIEATKKLTSKPFGVNLTFLPHPVAFIVPALAGTAAIGWAAARYGWRRGTTGIV